MILQTQVDWFDELDVEENIFLDAELILAMKELFLSCWRIAAYAADQIRQVRA
jgi:hypothetical protein